MLRLTMILLSLMLAAAAAGRFQAEASVREARAELKRLEREKSKELTQIQVLRAEIAYLESPDRLAAIATKMTDLKPLTGAQLLSADDFAIAFTPTLMQTSMTSPANVATGVVAASTNTYEVASIAAASAR